MLHHRGYLLLLGFWSIPQIFAQNETCNLAAPPGFSEPASFGNNMQPFLPYFVANGTESFDDSDTSGIVTYKGKWKAETDPSAVNSTLHATTDSSASVSFTFTGSGIEWFGTTGKDHSIVKVTLDREPAVEEEVDTFSVAAHEQQRLWSKLDLPVRKYTLTIKNTDNRGSGRRLDVDAFIVTPDPLFVDPSGYVPSSSDGWSLLQKGSSGVSAMQITIISPTHALIFDKVEHNYATIDGHPAWAVLYNLNTHELRPLRLISNSFCAAGSFLSNGTLASVGGTRAGVNVTSSQEYHDVDGRMSIRILEPCHDPTGVACNIVDMPNTLSVARWYATDLRIADGSALIIGGAHELAFNNNITLNEPSITFFPSSSRPIVHFDFLNRTLNANLFPHAFSLPNRRVLVISNTESVIIDWEQSPLVEETNLALPNGIRVNYPMAGTAMLLPLSQADNYTARVLVCGGSDAPDRLCDFQYSAQHSGSSQCSRIEIKRDGTTEGWKVDDSMPDGARVMPDSVLLPTGEVVIVNGARTGYSGFGSVIDPVGSFSNADHPALSPILYSPDNEPGSRFRQLEVRSNIPRLYHSVATLTPNGDVMIAGSNPNPDRSLTKYPADYRVEWLSPPYMEKERPTYTGLNATIDYGTTFTIDVQIPSSLDSSKIKVSLMDLGFATHSMHSNTRLVYLDATLSGSKLSVTAPPDEGVYPPGPGYIFVVVDGVSSKAVNTLVGGGRQPALH